MDVTPPSTLRRLGIALAGVAVAALTGAACALSFDDLRSLAELGEARADLAYLYPAAFDALLAVALISLLLLRSARLLVRIQTAIVLVVLLVAAAAANVSTALLLEPDVRQAAVGVAVAPWVMLAVALWLWLLLIKHVQDRRSVRDDDRDDDGDERDLVPFPRGRAVDAPPPLSEAPPLTEPLEQVLEPTPVVGPTPAPETPPIPERVTRAEAPQVEADTLRNDAPRAAAGEETAEVVPVEEDSTAAAAEALDAPSAQEAPRRETPRQEVPRQETPRPERPEAAPRLEAPLPEDAPRPETPRSETPRPETPRPETPQSETPPPEAPRQEPRRRPVRWGDRVKPTDVLVHPRTPAGKDADTQPVPVVADDRPAAGDRAGGRAGDRGPDPAHGREAADPGESPATAAAEEVPTRPARGDERDESMVDTAPHPVIHEEPVEAYDEAPARRMRSTPLPPEE
ncbi:DUF2637 domain-containing protein [Nonomuraea sp. SMC257]|uniref:DUF2637 domain-containing protein n=1 Tax=Nonomuraea montanisoli TaxID=2741721 RepID=A0A7Y6M905_9ACTN|nr:DUF2637 domain-containing protein [Nonomuraea montanisoli]NUW38101.1 DUF2637 domain-containing protein [Nonomuraea montanisoli]